MGLSGILFGILILGGLGFYYWYSFGRHGGNVEGYQKHQFKLHEEEKVLKYFFGAYHLEPEKKDAALALINVERVGKSLHFALTDRGRLVFREHAAAMADAPISLEKNQVKEVKVLEEEFGSLVGLSGKLEKLRTVEMHVQDGPVIQVDVPVSTAEVIREWAS